MKLHQLTVALGTEWWGHEKTSPGTHDEFRERREDSLDEYRDPATRVGIGGAESGFKPRTKRRLFMRQTHQEH